MEASVTAPDPGVRDARGNPLSPADVFMRRLLFVSSAGPQATSESAQNVFSASIAVSAFRCLLTYVLLPILGPVLNLTGSIGPSLGLVVSAVSIVAIVASMRRFWAATHRWRWAYGAAGGGVVALLVAQAVIDVAALT